MYNCADVYYTRSVRADSKEENAMSNKVQGTDPTEEVPTSIYLVVSRLSGLAGIACIIIAVVSKLTDRVFKATPSTYIEIAIAAFLFAILVVLWEMRDQGIRNR